MRKLPHLVWQAILWLRQIVFMFYVIVVTVVFATLTVILSWLHLPLHVRLIPARIWSKLMYVGMVLILWLRMKIEGQAHVPKTPCVFISKHQSAWETLIFHGIFPNICFVLKKELLKIPLFGQGLKAADSIPIDREQSLKSFKEVLQNGKQRLKNAQSIVIFPEGTRVPVGQYPKFHRTAMSLAKSTGAKLVPIAHNSGVFWPPRFGLIQPGCITLKFGEPILPEDFKLDALNQHCYKWINQEVKQLGG